MTTGSEKVALITGSATGIGRACATKFASLGFKVIVNYPGVDREQAEETVRLVEGQESEALLIECDVSRDYQVVAMVQQIEQAFGRLDVVVNCAGVTHFIEPSDLESMTEEKWDQILAVNTKGPFFVIRAAKPLLKKGPASSVVNISSAAGVSGFGSSVAYCASKGALNTMTKTLARALAPEIRVNAVCPGPIDSRWLRQGMTEEEIQDRVSTLPIPKIVSPEDVADTVAYLAIGTSKTTGQLLTVDCGRSM
jgi:3-oxoacyl-[acyl-carrier protein] reductase